MHQTTKQSTDQPPKSTSTTASPPKAELLDGRDHPWRLLVERDHAACPRQKTKFDIKLWLRYTDDIVCTAMAEGLPTDSLLMLDGKLEEN